MSDSAPVVSKIVAAPANLLAPELPAALETGFPAVDAEHRQLLACMRTLRGLCDGLYTRNDCSGCSVGQRQLCDNNLVSLLGDLLAFILEHFQTEEAAIRDSLLQIVDRDLCEAHAEDHAEISTKGRHDPCVAIRGVPVAEAMMESSTPMREAFGVISSTAKMEPGEAGETRPALNRVRVKTPVMPPAITARMRRGFIST